jgi:hypothetical protein
VEPSWWLGNDPLAENAASVGTFPSLFCRSVTSIQPSPEPRELTGVWPLLPGGRAQGAPDQGRLVGFYGDSAGNTDGFPATPLGWHIATHRTSAGVRSRATTPDSS